ncbi:MAG: hypothetical protein NC098_08885 [Lachnoclostridium sp.]|nr:hypothetical protein [Lachnoclostridium sp.]
MNPIEKLPIPVLKALGKVARHFTREILTIRYKRWTGRTINWEKPSNLQEYIFKKVADAENDEALISLMGDLADKVKVREYVRSRVGEGYLPELYGTWERAEDVDWDALPEKFVIKTNNGCGTNIIVKDKSKLDRKDAVKKLSRWMAFPYGELTGQPHYSRIKPLILAEEFLEEKKDGDELPHDYKFFCFKGVPRFILYYEGRVVNGHVCDNITYDMHWNKLNDVVNYPTDHDVDPPKSLELMTELARKLSEGFDFVRVDFYNINDKPVLGEMTFTPDVTMNFTPEFLKKTLEEYTL